MPTDKYLFPEAQATEEKAHAQNEQKVGQNGAKKRRLDDTDLILCSSQRRSMDNRLYESLPWRARCCNVTKHAHVSHTANTYS